MASADPSELTASESGASLLRSVAAKVASNHGAVLTGPRLGHAFVLGGGRSSRAPVPLQGAPDGMERRSRSGSALERTWTRPVGPAPGTRTRSLAHLDGLAGRARGCRNRPRVPGARPTGRDRVRSRLLEPGAAGERSRSAPGRSRTLPSRSRPGTPGARLEIGAPGPFQSRSRSAPGAGTGLQLSGAPLHTVGTAT